MSERMTSADGEPTSSYLPALPQALRLPALCLLIATAYFVLAGVGLSFLSNRVGVAAVWPANGVTLAALLLLPRRVWPAVLASAYAGNVLANLLTHREVSAAFVFSGVNAAESLAAGSAMWHYFRRRMRFETTREVILFAVFACAGCGLFGGLLGALSVHVLNKVSEPFLGVWLFWGVVDALGMLTVTPLIVATACHRPWFRSPFGLLEKFVCVSLFTVAVLVMFRAAPPQQVLLLNMPYVTLLPFFLWAGLRLDVRVSSLLTVVLVTVGAWSTLHGHGPFVVPGYDEGNEIVAFQMSAILWGMSALSLSAVTTERRAATFALRASEARARGVEREAIESKALMQAFFDHAEAMIYIKDREGRYLAVNRAFERALSLNSADVLGRRDADLFPEEMAKQFRQTDEIVMREERALAYEVESTLAGARGVFWSVKFPIRDARGEVAAACGISTDITARKRIERDLEAAKNAAEANARRAQELAEKADEANRAKTEFLANISHEIRTPLTSILGYAELMMAPGLPEGERIHNAQTIRRNGEHLLAILNDVLDMSKIEAGRMTIEHVSTGISDIMDEVMSLMHHRAAEKGLSLVVECRTPIPVRILSDPTRLRQIMMNLVGNAVKFTNHGEVRIVVGIEHGSAGDVVSVDVIDTGIGMSTEQVASLGQPFTQADPSHARRFGGSGLGLSICYRLAQLMGGAVSCRSQLGVGSTFTLRLPTDALTGIGRGLAPRDRFDAPVPDDVRLDLTALKGRVLIAEDAADTRRLLEAYLRRTSVDVHTVENGEAAVAEVMAAWRSGKPYDLILMDVQMPRMDGVAATTALRSQGYTGRIVALTANAMERDRGRCIAAGCDGFLTKPIRRDDFLNAARVYLTATETAGSGTGSNGAKPIHARSSD